MITREDLLKVRQWADDKLSTGEEPPWSWFQLMKLRETLDAIIAGTPKEVSTKTFRPHLVGGAAPVEADAPSVIPVQLPM